MKIALCTTVLCIALTLPVSGTEPVVATTQPLGHTLAYVEGTPRPKAAIRAMAWLAGHWRGPALGGISEEFWSDPAGGAMMGMFRSVKDGTVVFYELLTIVEDAGSLVLKLKHFHPDLKGWEEKDEMREFPLVKLGDREIFFDGMTFRRDGKNSMTIFVRFENQDGSLREEAFVYRRVQ